MKLFFTDFFQKKQISNQEETAVVTADDSFHNITEGGEFVDDAIRMKEQPFIKNFPEDGAPAGCATEM